MLNLVLSWAELDGAISMMTAAYFGLDTTRATILLGKMSSPMKLLKLRRLQLAFGHTQIASKLKSIRANYEKGADLRNKIAHSKCIGSSRSDPDRVYLRRSKRDKLAN